jgi:protein CpxP
MESKKLPFWKIFAIALLVINTLILSYILLEKPGQNSSDRGPAAFIIKELHFNDSQIVAFEKLKFAHQDSVQHLREQGKILREKYFSFLRNDANSISKVGFNNQLTDLENQIAANQVSIESVTYRHFGQVKEICDSSQKHKFDSILLEIVSMMKAGRPKPAR